MTEEPAYLQRVSFTYNSKIKDRIAFGQDQQYLIMDLTSFRVAVGRWRRRAKGGARRNELSAAAESFSAALPASLPAWSVVSQMAGGATPVS